MIVKPWEELLFNKNQHTLGYDKGNNFHIPVYSKLVMFVRTGRLDEDLKTSKFNDIVDDQHIEEKLEFQHCHTIGHMENQCLDLNPYLQCGKTNHLLEKCQSRRIIKRKQRIMAG
jgi:hypothetical protein